MQSVASSTEEIPDSNSATGKRILLSNKLIRKNAKLKLSKESNFQFISVQTPADAKDRDKRRLARSHAVRQGLLKRRKLQEASSSDPTNAPGQTLLPWLAFAPESAYGPFETILGDSPKLRALLSCGMMRNGLRHGDTLGA